MKRVPLVGGAPLMLVAQRSNALPELTALLAEEPSGNVAVKQLPAAASFLKT